MWPTGFPGDTDLSEHSLPMPAAGWRLELRDVSKMILTGVNSRRQTRHEPLTLSQCAAKSMRGGACEVANEVSITAAVQVGFDGAFA